MKIKTLLALAAATLALAACNKQPEPAPATDLSVNPTSHEFPAVKAGDDSVKVFAVTSNTDWSATAPADVFWFSVVEANGKGNGNFKVILSQSNPTDAVRSAKVTVRAGSKTVEVTISQAAKDAPKAVTIKINDAQQFIEEVLKKSHNTVASRDTTFEITSDLNFTGITPVFQIINFYPNIIGKGPNDSPITISNWESHNPMFFHIFGKISNIKFDKTCSCYFNSFPLKTDSTPAMSGAGIICYANVGGIIEKIINESNVTFDGTEAKASNHYGALMGINRSIVRNCENHGNITVIGDNKYQLRIGGIVGSFAGNGSDYHPEIGEETTIVANCTNTGNIALVDASTMVTTKASQEFLGGICGFFESKEHGTKEKPTTTPIVMDSCTNTGKISYDGEFNGNPDTKNGWRLFLGGLIGARKAGDRDDIGDITNCTNTGAVSGGKNDYARVGGLIGEIRPASSEAPSAMCMKMFSGCSVNCTVSAQVASADTSLSNPCSNAGIICGDIVKADDTQIGYLATTIGSSDSRVTVAGTINCTAPDGGRTVPVSSSYATLFYGSSTPAEAVAATTFYAKD